MNLKFLIPMCAAAALMACTDRANDTGVGGNTDSEPAAPPPTTTTPGTPETPAPDMPPADSPTTEPAPSETPPPSNP